MHTSQLWWLLWISLLAACGQQATESTTTPTPTTALRSLPSPTAPIASPTLSWTPLPTSTSSPTATPMLHTVIEGETLIGIALDHDVTLEALQAVNGEINPLNLQPGQLLVIPQGEAGHGSLSLPTPTPLALIISQFNCYPTPAGGLLCLGEASNRGSKPIINLAVQVTLVLPDGPTGRKAEAFSPIDFLWPGQSLPLATRFSDAGEATSALTQVLAADSASDLVDSFVQLSVQDISGETRDLGGYLVTGRVLNDSEKPVNEIKIVVTLYDDGMVRAFRLIDIKEILQPGDSVPITVTFPESPAEAAGYTAVAQGRYLVGHKD